MIKTIAAKIISNYFGKFIKGVSKENLEVSLFGGTAKLSNISINEQLFDNAGLPIELAYSSIGVLDLQMSPSKLGSTPVECTLEDVFMVFKFKNKTFTQADKINSQKTRQLVEDYAKQCLEKFKARLQTQKEQGMFAKIGKKVIDNLQLKVVNLHIRFQEEGVDKKYSWGVTLEEIQFVTTNQKWQLAFIDRSVQANKNAVLYKKMEVKNLGVYWQSQNVVFTLNKDDIKETLRKGVMSNQGRIINISSQFQLKINPLNHFETSVYELHVSLSPINISLTQGQLSQTIDFMERIVVHNQLKHMFKKKVEKSQDIDDLQKTFKTYMSAHLDGYSNFNQETSKVFQRVPLDDLLIWTITQVKSHVRNLKISQLQNQKKGGWFSSSSEVTKEEMSELQTIIQNAFQQQTQSLRPPACPFYSIYLSIPSGQLNFSQFKDGSEEILKFMYSKLLFEGQKSSDDSNLKLIAKLSSLALKFYQGENQLNILQSVSSNNNDFFQLSHQKKTVKESEVYETFINAEQLIGVYRYLFIKKFREFFTFRSVDEVLKSLTLQKIQNIQTENKQELKSLIQQKNNIKVSIKSPVLLIPFNNSQQSQCWACNLGNLTISSQDKCQDSDFQYYQFFNFKLEQVSLIHLQNMQLCYLPDGQKDSSPLLNDINLAMLYKQRRILVDPKTYYKDIFSINLDAFSLKFTHKQYRNLIQLIQVLRQGKKSRLQELKKEKDKLQSVKVYQGKIRKQNNLLKNWTDYYAILSGSYIYFYNDKRDLKFCESVFIKNSKVQLNDSNLQIVNKYQQCILTTQKQDLQSWKVAVEDQVKRYATNVQFFDLYSQPDQKPIVKKQFKKQHAFKFNLGVLDCHYEDQNNKLIASFKLLELKLQNQSNTTQEKTIIEFYSFDIADKVFEYEDPKNQTFISVRGQKHTPSVSITKFKECDEHKGEGQRLNVVMKLPVLTLNWKPEVILLLVDLSKKHLDRQEVLRENDYEMRLTGAKLDRTKVISDLKNNKQFQLVDQSHNNSNRIVKYERDKYLTLEGYEQLSNNKYPILFTFQFDIEVLECQLFHRQSHVLMFRISAENIKGDISFTEDEKFLKGGIQEVQLLQMFNYPNTTNSNIDYKSITPHLVLGRKGKYEEPCVEFKWSSYQEKTFFNKQRVNGFLLLSFNPASINYVQQVTFRAIDYILIQIIMLLTNPDQVVANQGLLQQLKNNQEVHQQVILVWGKFEEITKKLLSPFFFDICIDLKEPTIILKAQPNTDAYFMLNSKRVRLNNQTFRRKQRFSSQLNLNPDLANSIWQQQYNILAEDLELKIIHKKQQKDLWLPINLKMNINRLLNQDEIKHIFPETSVYNRGFRIKSSSNQIKLNLNKFEYLQVLKLLNFNITFEDQRDQLFIHNYKITKLLSPKPIDFKLVIPSLLFAADYNIDTRIDTLFSIHFQDLEIQYRRSKELINNISLITPSILLNSSKNGVDIPIVKAPEQNLRQEPIKLDVQMRPNGEKIVSLYMQSAKIVLKLQLFQLIFEWALVQQWIFPVQSSIVLPILFMTNINRVIICLQSDVQQTFKHGFAALGTLSFKFSRKRNKTQSWYREELLKKRMTSEQFENQSELSKMSVSLNIELCRCRYDDFLCMPFSSINKRTIIYPLTLNYSDLSTRTLSDPKAILFNNTSKKSINADKASIKIATKDIIFLNELWGRQFKQDLEMKKIMQYIKALKFDIPQPDSVIKQSNQISTLATTEVSISSTSIVLINNYKDSFVPLINPIVQNFNLTYFSTYKKSILQLKFQIMMNYFNGELLKWQPILERVTLMINYSNYFQSKKRLFSAQTKQKIKFAVTKQCLYALSSSSAQWKSTSKQQPKCNEPVQFISHYIIVNNTGYPIDIYNIKGQLKNKIGIDNQDSYDVQLGDINSNQQNTLVNIFIKHPKIQFEPLKEIQLNSNKVRRIATHNKKQSNKNLTLVVRPKYKDLKQYVYISGAYCILDHTKDKPVPITIPFDQNINNLRLGDPHNIQLSIQKLRQPIQTKLYRYSLQKNPQDRMYEIKINYRNTATNLLPIPININGTYVHPNKSIGFTGELLLQGIKYSTTKTLKTFINKNQVSIFCDAYIVDYYGLQIAYDTLTDIKPINPKYIAQQKLKNGNANITLIYSPKQKLVFRMKGRKNWSKAFTPTLGKNFFKIIEGLSQMEFVVVTKIKTINDHKGQRLVTVIEISPKYIIVNSSHHKLKISQADSVQSAVLEHGQREPFFWENTKKPKYIKICSFDDKSMWGYSGPIDLSIDFHCFYLRKAQDVKQSKIFIVELQHTSHVTYINITHGDSPYRLQNDLKKVQMLACQAEIFKSQQVLNPIQIITQVDSGENIPFAYQFPSADKGIIINLRFPLGQNYQCQSIKVDLQKELYQKRILISRDKKPVGYYLLVLQFQGNSKKLRLTDRKKEEAEDEPNLQVTMKLPQLSLSLIGRQQQIRKELLYFIFEEIQAGVSNTNKEIQYSLFVKNCRIQNERSAKPLFPIMLQATAQPYLQFLLVKDNKNSKLIHYIGLSINKSAISLTSDQFAILHQNINQMGDSVTGNKSLEEAVTDYDFYHKIMSERAESYYFMKAEIHPFESKLNFKNVGDLGGHMGKTFTSVSQATVRTDGIKIGQFSCKDISEFMSRVMEMYKENIVGTVLPMIGNISILGNPATLFNSIGSGFKDLVTLPAKGFEVSPLEGGKGIGRGVKSLFQKTVQGTFNSVEAIGDTIGTGLASLTFDQQFERERDRIRNQRSEDVLDGLMNGGKSLLNGIGDGFIGLVRNPIEGAQKQGIGGFFLGAVKGIGGLVLKPLSGVVDFTAKTAQGIKNTTQMMNPTNQNTRNHLPRVFYTPGRQYRTYDTVMAQVNNLIETSNAEKYSNLSWCNGFIVGKNTYLALTYQYMIFFSLESYQIAKEFDSIQIIGCKEQEETKKSNTGEQKKAYFVVFLINKKQNDNGQLKIPVQSKQQGRSIVSSVKQIIQYYHGN